MTSHFYIHIPFCNQKCPYCKFALTPIFDEFKKKRYIEYLKKEIREYSVGYQNSKELCTIYFGGGTPSILSHQEIREILECFPFYGKNPIEITLESNPEDITQEYVEGLIDLGMNRLSMGIQTLNDTSLKEISRSNRESIENALENIKKAILEKKDISVNIDFILGLPYTKKGEIFASIQELHSSYTFLTHTSVYMLEDEAYPKHWKENSISEIELQEEFLSILTYFENREWNHYELSNFSKPGFESIHNQGYWNHSNTRGFGLSSASYENRKRWNNSSSFNSYYRGRRENEEVLDEKQIQLENLMFALRTSGIQQDIITEISPEKLSELIEDHLLEIQNNIIRVTKTGIFMIDHIMGELLI